MHGNDFPDRIVTNHGDTIECSITLVNDEHVYFYYMHRDIRRPDRLSVNDIKGYTWSGECSHNTSDKNPFTVAEKEPKKWGYGFKVVQQFNLPIYHSIVAINVRKGNHNMYVGPHYTYMAKEKIRGDLEESFSQTTWGVNMGYMIVIKTRNEVFDVFAQFDVSMYEAQTWFYDGPYSGLKSERELVFENCVSVGIKYNISDKFETFGGYGIGSTENLFFMFEGIVPHIYLGLQFNIK